MDPDGLLALGTPNWVREIPWGLEQGTSLWYGILDTYTAKPWGILDTYMASTSDRNLSSIIRTSHSAPTAGANQVGRPDIVPLPTDPTGLNAPWD